MNTSEPDKREPRAFGTWDSPITPTIISEQFTTIDDVIVDPKTRVIYHIEGRPREAGRCVLIDTMCKTEITGDSFDVQTGVNSYGGAAAAVFDGIAYFSNYRDGRVYMQRVNSREAIPITPPHVNWKFAYFVTHPVQKHIIFVVFEDHTDPSPDGIKSFLGYIDTRNQYVVRKLIGGADFYSSPLISPVGNKLGWIEWNHPYMPWQGGQLFIGDLTFSDGQMSLHKKTFVAGKPGEYAVHEFVWTSNLSIVFMSDEYEYIEAFVYEVANARRHCSLKSVFGAENSLRSDFSDPKWLMGDTRYTLLDDSDQHICVTIKEGIAHLHYIEPDKPQMFPMDSPYVEISRLRRVDDNTLVFIGASDAHSASVIRITFDRDWTPPAPKFTILAGPDGPYLDKSLVPPRRSIRIPKVNGKFTFAHYYKPTNPKFRPITDEKPPCIISLHPEPISRAQTGFLWHRTYFTSHGFGWLDIDCVGSIGYGKRYRKRLDGEYGNLDIEDIIDAVEYGALDHNYDRKRVCLRATGEAAWIALQIMEKHPNSFAAAVSHNMVADVTRTALAANRLKRHHIANLMGGQPDVFPNKYSQRDPLRNIHRITCPFFITHSKLGSTFYQSKQVVDILREKDRDRRIQHAFFDERHNPIYMYREIYHEELKFVACWLVQKFGVVGATAYNPITGQTDHLPPTKNVNHNSYWS